MNRSSLIFLIIASIVAITISIYNASWISYKNFTLARKEKKIDYYLSNFTLINLQEDGKMRYLVKGKHLIHQQATGASEIFNPILEARAADNSILSIVAEKAAQLKKNGDIKLEGNVVVNKQAISDSLNGFNIQTSDLTYNPIKKEINSEAKIIFKSIDDNFLQGTGFSSKLDEQEFRIHSNVQAKYEPKK